jgi:hypothetical protein
MTKYLQRANTIMSNALKIFKPHEVKKVERIRRFLLEMLIAHEWSSEYQHMLVEDKQSGGYRHIADYLYDLGLLQLNRDDACDYKYDISERGRKWLDKFNKGENYE